MPELPEVETVVGGLSPQMKGHRILHVIQRRKNLRFDFPSNFQKQLEGKTVQSLYRRSKYILGELDNGEFLLMHLGMSGSFRIVSSDTELVPGTFYYTKEAEKKHDHVEFYMSSGVTIVYNDPRRFGFMTLIEKNGLETHPLLKDIGPEPLGNQFNAEKLANSLKSKKTPIKSALLDQKIVAGLGNIYVCEALHRAKISPTRTASSLVEANGAPKEETERLVVQIRSVLNEAIRAGGSSLQDHRQTNGELGYFQHSFTVYGREGEACSAKNCKGVVERLTQSGRSTFFCPSCQK